jgi:hypothetical protein
LPYVRDAFDHAVNVIAASLPQHLRETLEMLVRQLCDPDPTLRGDPKERGPSRNRYSLERYTTQFDLLARRAECGLFRSQFA